MTMYFSGAIYFKKPLTEAELVELKEQVELNPDSTFYKDRVELEDCWDALDDITDWLTFHNNNVEPNSIVEYWGDCDGAARYENGEWVWYDSEPLCSISDEELIKEIKYRGYLICK